MASQITFQESMFVRVKDEEEAFDCTGANHDRSYSDLAESNHDSNHSREQVMHGEKTTTDNHEPFKQITGRPRISVKQERTEELCYSSRYTDRSSSAYRRNRSSNKESTAYESRDEVAPENVKERQSAYSSRLESKSRPDSHTYTDSVTTSKPTSSVAKSLFFPWQPRERIAAEHSLSPRTSFLCFPSKQVFSHFQTTSPFLTENFCERPRHFSAEMKVDTVRREQQQNLQHKGNHRVSSVYGDGNVSEDSVEEELRPSIRPQSLSPPGKPKKSGSSKQNGSSQRTEKPANSILLNRKDEEPVWKKYQWYRDRKRPYSQQAKRQKTEQPIFMQYNKMRDKRCKEGRLVSNNRRILEPWTSPVGSKSDALSSSVYDTVHDTQNGARDMRESSGSPNKRKKVSLEFAFSEEGRQLRDGVGADQDFLQHKNTTLHYTNGRGGLHLVGVDENGNFEKHKTQNALSTHEVNSRNDFESSVNTYKISSPHLDEDTTSSSLYEDRVDVSPGALRRYPQDVAKILRLNRIVKAVKYNRMGQQAAEKIKRPEVDYREGESHKTNSQGTVLIQREENQIKSQSNSNQESDDRGSEHQTKESDNEKRNLQTSNRFFASQDQKQLLNGTKRGFEEHPDFSNFTHSSSDQESVIDEHMNAVQDSDPVCQVNGLLALPGLKETKFNITLGELKRRMNPPETLTRVEMISYVRQAKSSGRVLLDKNNIVTANRSHPTILSRVCEGEAQVLADGILKMNREYLPMALLARKTVDAYKGDGCRVENCEDCRLKLRRRIVDVEITRNSLKELQTAIEESKKEDGFQSFELASHTFGMTNILNHLALLDDYFRVLLLTLQDE